MTNDADVSLESEDLARELEKAAPRPPVVLVQYKKRGIPSWVAFPLIVAMPIISILVYHRFVVEPYRSRAAEAERVLEAWIKATRPGAPSPVQVLPAGAKGGGSGLVAAPASLPQVSDGKSGAVAAVAAAAPAAGAPERPSSSPAAPTSAPAPGSDAPSSVAQAPVPPSFTPPARVTADPAPASGLDATLVAAARAPDSLGKTGGAHLPPAQRVGSTAGDPKSNPQGGGAAAKPQPATKALAVLQQAEDLAVSAPGPAPAEVPKNRSPDPSAGARIGGVHTRSLGIMTDDANNRLNSSEIPRRPNETQLNGAGQQDRAGFEPLPTREESLRAIAEEAARKQAEIAESRVNRQVEIDSLRAEDRVKFRNELAEILRVHGNKAGDEIDRLARRYGYEASSTSYERALRIWKFGRMSQLAKVRLIRSLDLPESVILDFLSDNQYGRLSTRNGPHNENEVRIRAARQLLAYELPSQSAPAQPAQSGRQSADSAVHAKGATAPDGIPH